MLDPDPVKSGEPGPIETAPTGLKRRTFFKYVVRWASHASMARASKRIVPYLATYVKVFWCNGGNTAYRITVNGRKISKVVIDPHYEAKHPLL